MSRLWTPDLRDHGILPLVDDVLDMLLVLAAVLTGLLGLYTVVRLAVRDGVLDARAKDDAELAQRNPKSAAPRRPRAAEADDTRLDDLLDAEGSS